MIASMVHLAVVGITNFVLPKFTSVDTYAATKEYTLYLATYSNILSAGYIQGVYLKYGGKELNQSNKVQVAEDYFTFVAFQLLVSSVIFALGAAFGSTMIKVVGIGLFSGNLVSYYQYLYQAVGDYAAYGVALNASQILALGMYFILLFVLKTDRAGFYLAVPVASCMIMMVFLTLRLNRKLNFFRDMRVNVRTGWKNIRGGFVLMLGSFVSRFFTTIDRWFVKTLMQTFYFASYSFAVSLEKLVGSFMAPLTVSLYNYFCKEYVPEKVRILKDLTSIYACVIIAAAFPAKWILEHFMERYLNASAVIFLLFASQGVGTVVRAVYVNQYKARGQQKKYLFQIMFMVCIAVALNGVLYYFLRRMVAIALATLITNLIWLLLCEMEMPELRYPGGSALALGLLMGIYLFAGFALSSVWGFAVYVLSVPVMSLLFMRKSTVLLVNKGMRCVKLKFAGGRRTPND